MRIRSVSLSLSDFSQIAGRLTEINRPLKTAWDHLTSNLQCTKAKTTIHNWRIFVNDFPCYIGKARVSASNKIAKKFPIFVAYHGNGDN